MVPDLNRETRQALGEAGCGYTFFMICFLLGYECYKGRATWDQQRLGIGLRALARETGQDVRKVRRDCTALQKLGLVVIHRPKVLHTADPKTGKITTKSKGRCENTVIYLTITEAHLRPAKGRSGTEGGTTVVPPPAACKDHGGTTVIDKEKLRTPDGGADRVGTPPAAGAGLTAGEAPASILPVNAGRDAPDVPAGRILPSPRPQAAATGRRRPGFTEDHAGPQTFTGEAAAAFERTRRRLEAERLQRAAQDATGEAPAPQAARHDPPQAAPPPRRRPVPPVAFDHAAARAAVLSALAVT